MEEEIWRAAAEILPLNHLEFNNNNNNKNNSAEIGKKRF